MITPSLMLDTPTAPAVLTPAEALASAKRLRGQVAEEAEATEERGFHSPELHRAFAGAGFYHMLRPRMFGGYEFSVADFMAVMRELAAGDMATAWCLTLASGHNLQVASWWPEEAQREFFAGGYFAAPMTSAPAGTLTRVEGGFLVNGEHKYASGVPYSTHFAGHARHAEDETKVSTFVAPRDTYEVLPDWGSTLGLRGSGSHSVLFRDAFIPAHYVLEGVMQTNVDVSAGTPGYRLHRNPMYLGRGGAFFQSELANLTVGAVQAAIELYRDALTTRKTIRPPIVLRSEDDKYLWWFGDASARIRVAQAAVEEACRMFDLACRHQADGTKEYTRRDDMFISMVARNALAIAWDVMQSTIFHSSGSSAATRGSRLERIYRDTSMAWGHLGTLSYAWSATDFARQTLEAAQQLPRG